MAREVHIFDGGLGGICLALRLTFSRYPGRVVLYTDETHSADQARWSTWGPLPRFLSPFVRHVWTAFCLGCEDEIRSHHQSGSPYIDLEGSELLPEARRRLSRLPNVSIEKERAATTSIPPDAYVLEPAGKDGAPTGLVRSFERRRVRHEQACFGRAARVMELIHEDAAGLRYVTMLPFGPREAVVETVHLGPEAASGERHAECLERYLQSRFPGPTQTLDVEEGRASIESFPRPFLASPLRGSLAPDRPSGAIVGLSLPGILDRVQTVASAIEREAPLPPLRAKRATSHVDRTLREAILERPQKAYQALSAIFRLPTEVVVRYLSERPTWSDCAAILSAMPKSPLLEAALRPITLGAPATHPPRIRPS